MNGNIRTESGNIGLPQEVYTLKPAKNSSFTYSYSIDEFKQPQNIIEEIKEMFNNAAKKIKYIVQGE